MFIHSFCCFVRHKGQCNLIFFPCHSILRRRDNRQLEIHVSNHALGINSFSLLPLTPPCLCLQPPLFLPAQIIDQPPSVLREQGFGGTAEREEISLGLNQTTSSIMPLSHPSPFPRLSLLPQSLGCNGLSHVLYLMTCESN